MTNWADNVLPVLEASYRVSLREAGEPYVTQDAVNEEMGREPGDVQTARALHDLWHADYVDDVLDGGGMGAFGPQRFTLTEKALQIVAGWPGFGGESLFSRMLAELDERVASASTPEERTRLERLRDGLVGVGRDVFTNVISAGRRRRCSRHHLETRRARPARRPRHRGAGGCRCRAGVSSNEPTGLST